MHFILTNNRIGNHQMVQACWWQQMSVLFFKARQSINSATLDFFRSLDSNPGPLGVKRERYLCAMRPPVATTVSSSTCYLSCHSVSVPNISAKTKNVQSLLQDDLKKQFRADIWSSRRIFAMWDYKRNFIIWNWASAGLIIFILFKGHSNSSILLKFD